MAIFRPGQNVEVWGANMYPWRKAKISKLDGGADLRDCGGVNWYEVRFHDGSCGLFSEEHIRIPIGTFSDVLGL